MSKFFVTALAIVAAFLSLGMTACTMNENGAHFTGVSSGDAPPGSFCYENTALCVVGGVAAAGLAAGVIANSNSSNGNGGCAPGKRKNAICAPSDSRLKQDVRPLATRNDGLKVYTFHYRGDSRLFSGVMAQDLLQNPAFAKAVSVGADGYYRVDYSMLGLPLVNGKVMSEAGEKAAAAL